MIISKLLSESHVLLGVKETDPFEVARVVGNLLVEDGSVAPEYLDAMVKNTGDSGSCLVLTDGFALCHARPEQGANRLCAAVVTLEHPVCFGPAKEPVDVAFAFANPEPDGHVLFIQQLALLLLEEGFLDSLRKAKNPRELIAVVQRYEEKIGG